ncbi:HNH endonuclease signature motif containing protein [Phaeobacter sp. PT47_59]|uniref:HNH endonuclease n=1 Tax=Phaeobacter sp. PT47_59 TaxID=3029979 RepID=UPI00238083B2|nr:HNH endonuclease signature motif containing protein [Phaeobacter sp. PT47_59]MDE4176336.1 HNH endonuclease signature motif containing protein [Phaeobacter sp. PT47_59]
MSRPVPEWIGRTDSTPAPARVKARIVMAQDGICACGCGVKLGAAGEGIDFDHTQALILGGENRESNLRALRRPCHGAKTKQDVKQKSVEARKRNKHLGLNKKRSRFQTSRDGPWKQKIGGQTVPRE